MRKLSRFSYTPKKKKKDTPYRLHAPYRLDAP